MNPTYILLTSLLAHPTMDSHREPSFSIPVQEHTLSNGLTVWLNEDHTEHKIIGSLVVRAGAKDSPDTGIAHYFEHIMFKGTDRIGTVDYKSEKPILDEIRKMYDRLSCTSSQAERDRIQKQINELSVQAARYAIPNDFNNLITSYGGSGLNAGTSYDYTVYYNTFTPQYLRQWCILNSERLIHPVFRLFQSELETVYEEKNMYEDQLGAGAMQRVLTRLAAPHPYQYPIIGSTEHLKNPRLSDMEKFFHDYYVAGNMGLILVGDFDAREIVPLLEETFGKIRSGEAPISHREMPVPFKGREKLSVKLPLPFVRAAAMVWRTVPNTHPDALKVSVLGRVLTNSGKTGLLDKLSLEGKLMAAGGMPLTLNEMGVFGVFAMPNLPFGTTRGALKALGKTIRKVKEGNFDDDLFERIKNEVLREHLLKIESVETRSKVLVALFAQGESWKEIDREIEQLRAMQKSDIVQVAQKYLSDNYLEISKKTGDYPKEKIIKPDYHPPMPPSLERESEMSKRLKSLPVERFAYPYLDLHAERRPESIGEKGLIHLYHTPHRANNVFDLHLVFRRGSAHDPLLKYLADYLNYTGTEKRSMEEFNEKLQGLGSSLSYKSSADKFTFSLTGFDEHLGESVALLAEMLYHPQANEKGMKQIRSAKRVQKKAILKDPEELSKLLFDYIRWEQEAPHMKDLRESRLKKVRGRDLLESLSELRTVEADIHYIGSLGEDKVREIITTGLDVARVTLPGDPLSDKPSSTRTHNSIYFYNKPEARQSIIRMYIPLKEVPKEDRRELTLLNKYLGGGMGSLLFQEVREYRSLAYGVYSQMHLLPPAQNCAEGELWVYLSTQSDKTVEALRTLDSLLQSDQVSDQRLLTATKGLRNQTIRMYPELRKRTLSVASLRRAGYEKDPAQEILEATEVSEKHRLEKLLKKYINNSKITYTIVGDMNRIDSQDLGKFGNITEMDINTFTNF